MKKRLNPKTLVLIAVIFISFSSILTKISQAPALVIAAYRLFFTSLILLPTILRKNIREIKGMDRKSLLICLISGLFLAFHFATWNSSLKYTSVASAAVLVNTHPIFVVIGSYLLFQDRIPKKALAGIGVAFMGGAIISAGDASLGSNILYGDFLAVAGAFFVSGYFMMGRIIRQNLSVTTYTFLVYTSSVVFLLMMIMITKAPLGPYPLKEWLIFLGLSIFCTILGHSIFNWALAYVKPTFISTAVLGEPVGATLWAMMIFGEIPRLGQLLGSAIIIYGIYTFVRHNQEDPVQDSKPGTVNKSTPHL